MKTINALALLGIVALGSTAYAEQGRASLPESLNCQEVICVYGSFCKGSDGLQSLKLSAMRTGQPSLETGDISTVGAVASSNDKDEVVLDFSDGDQTETITFNKNELSAMSTESVVRGLHRTGYWWADGDHTNALTVIECKN
jgi:hypothetical protein